MSSRRPADSRLELIDARNYEPQLRRSESLGVPPSETAQVDRAGAQRTWRALQATPEEIAAERAELDKMDRAVLAMRRQVHAARAEARSAREQLAQVERERYPAPIVWSVGAAAALAGVAWLYERRKARSAGQPALAASLMPVGSASTPVVSQPLQGDSTFQTTDPNATAEEAEEWVERLRGGTPRP